MGRPLYLLPTALLFIRRTAVLVVTTTTRVRTIFSGKGDGPFSNELSSGSALLMTVFFMFLLSIPVAMAMSWASEMRTMSLFYKGPRSEIDFLVRQNFHCDNTRAALKAAGGCKDSHAVEVRNSSNQVVISDSENDYVNRKGKVIAKYKISCLKSKDFVLEIAVAPKTSAFVAQREIHCK